MLLRSVIIALGLLAVAGCISAPQVHERALTNNELCAQQIGLNDLDRAEVYCDLGLQFSPQYADLWVNKGIIALRRGNQDQAKEHLIKALRYNQEQAQAYNNLGYIYLQEQSYGKAHDNFQRALKVNPDYIEARYNLALTFSKMGETDKAKKEYATILAIDPNIADVHNNLGIIAIEAGAYEQAVEHILKATQLAPDFADAWLNLGLAYTELSRFSEAKEAYTACIEADPKNAPCLNNLAVVTRKAALVDPTLKEIADTQNAENTPQSLYQLGQTYRAQGLKAEEKRAYQRCLKLDGKFAACHFALYELYTEEQKRDYAEVACKNFLKYAQQDDFPDQIQTCERFLSANTY